MFSLRKSEKIKRIGTLHEQVLLYNRFIQRKIYVDIRDAYCGIKRFENSRTPAPLHVILMFNKLLRSCLITF